MEILTDRERSLIRNFRKLKEEKRKKFLEFVEKMKRQDIPDNERNPQQGQ